MAKDRPPGWDGLLVAFVGLFSAIPKDRDAKAECLALLRRFGVERLSQLPAEQYPEMHRTIAHERNQIEGHEEVPHG